jgi:hypothetical protein
MRQNLTPRTRRRLDIQGFDAVDVQELAPVAPWLRLAFGLCGLLGGVGTLLASPIILLVLALIAALAAASPVQPFDLIYNYGIRYFTGTGPLSTRGAPTRFGCGMGAVLVLVTAWRSLPDTRSWATRLVRAHVRGASREHDGHLHSLADLPIDLRLAPCP